MEKTQNEQLTVRDVIAAMGISRSTWQKGVCSGWGRNPTLRGFHRFFWPPVSTGEEDMCPSEGRDVGEKVFWGALAFLFSFGGGLTEVEGVPMDHDGCKQV